MFFMFNIITYYNILQPITKYINPTWIIIYL